MSLPLLFSVCILLCSTHYTLYIIFMARQPMVGLRLLIVEVSISHTDTPHSVRLFRMSDRPVAETSTWQHTALTRGGYPCPQRESNSQSQQASGRRPTPWTARPPGLTYFPYSSVRLRCRLNFTVGCACKSIHSWKSQAVILRLSFSKANRIVFFLRNIPLVHFSTVFHFVLNVTGLTTVNVEE